jgi:hypothetical protein
MEGSKAVLPLPPGMVPSASREDMTDLGDKPVERKSAILKEVSSKKKNSAVRCLDRTVKMN